MSKTETESDYMIHFSEERPTRITFRGVDYDCTLVEAEQPNKPDPRLTWAGAKDYDDDRIRIEECDKECVSVHAGEGSVYTTPPLLYAAALACVRAGMALEGLDDCATAFKTSHKQWAESNLQQIVAEATP